MEKLKILIYVSTTNNPWNSKRLNAFLEKCRVNNKRDDITGILLLFNNKFIQVLEGRETELSNLFDKIKKDKRHHDILTLFTGDINNRCFNEWLMGFKELSQNEFESITGFSNIDALFHSTITTNSNSIITFFLNLFYNKNIKN